MIITIDGPTASGKSTLAVLLAKNLGYYYLNTGFLYRGLSYVLQHEFGYTIDQLAHPQIADVEHVLNSKRFVYTYQDGQAGIIYEGTDITPFLKTKENDQASSVVSGDINVRNALLGYQRHFTQTYNVIAEGRDTGTVVFPHAQLKVYLTASIEERARRWQEMQHAKGREFTLQESIAQVQERDERDSSRSIAPLTIALEAKVIDTTHLTQQQTIDAIRALLP